MTEKYYTIGTHTSEQRIELHAELIADGNVYDSVPSRGVSVDSAKSHKSTRGDYLLTEEEAIELKSDPRVKFINLSMSRYQERWTVPEEELIDGINGQLTTRWSDPSHHWQYHSSGFSPTSQFISSEPDINRNSAQLLRMQERRNPWIQNRNLSILDERNQTVSQRGAGENVDVIVADNGCWIGHTEFINTGVFGAVNPDDYIGGNLLPGDGICDVLDLVLDSPYYIDPDWFNANPATRLMTRWDGTTVPTETAARSWWQNSSQRSAEFAVFGNIPVTNSYTRNRCHGSNSVFPTTGTHGTQCGSQTYGRTHGWAYNSNKWHLNLYGSGNTGWENSFDIQRVFHEHKPNNPVFNTKDPTIVSNSWSFKRHKVGTHYYFNGSGPTAYTYDSSDGSGEPDFLRRATAAPANPTHRFKSEMKDNSMTQAADDCLESGVIWFCSAGNNYQNIVNPDHPSYDNRIANDDTISLYNDDFESSYSNLFDYTGTTNRRGFPQQAGKTEGQTFQGNTTVKFPCISVGALDDQFTGFTSGRERKVEYSDHGSAVDFFCVADGTIAATVNAHGSDIARVDNSYNGLTARNDARDTYFNGTSSATPIAVGFFATVLQYNRNWTYEDIRNYVDNYIENQLVTDLHNGSAEPTTANGVNWYDRTALFSSPRKVLYQPATSVITTPNPLAVLDTTAPVITINGPSTVTHERFASYTDAGATADGGETVSTTGTVNVNTVGTYSIVYSATDASGNTGSTTRTVNVVDTTAPTIETSNIITNINEGDTSLGYVTSSESNVTWSVYGTSQADVTVSGSQNNTATISLANPADFELQSSYSFVVSATDASANVGTATITIDVTNDPSDDPVPVPFPTTVGLPEANSKFGFSDAFNRADGRLDSSVNWEEVTDGANHVMIDNEELEQDGVGTILAYVNSSRYDFNDDQQASIVMEHYDNTGNNGDYVGPAVRVNPSGACYTLFLTSYPNVPKVSPLMYNDGSDSDINTGWSLIEMTPGQLSWLDVTEDNGWNTGYYSSNKITLRVIGSQLSILLNDVVKATVTDNRLTSGQPGIGMGNFTGVVKVSDFSAFSQPLNVFTDNFNRSDSGLSVSNNWSVWDHENQPVISTVSTPDGSDFKFVNNKLIGGSHSTWATARVNPSAQDFEDDQEASIYLTDMTSIRNYFAANPDIFGEINALGVAVRVNNTGEGYVAVVDPIRGDLGGLYRTDDSGNIDSLYDDFIEADSGHWSTYRGIGNHWNYTDSPEKLTLRVEGNILTVLVNDRIVEVLDVTETSLPSNKLLTRGQPGIYHEGYAYYGGYSTYPYDLAIDNFEASAFVQDSGPIGTQFFIRSVSRTGLILPSFEDDNSISLARDILANSYTSPGGEGDPPSIEVSDPYYASGRYDYSANDDYHTDFKDTIRDGNGENFYLSELELPPAVAFNSASYNQYHVDLMLYPTGQIDELSSGWNPTTTGQARTLTANILDPNGNVINSDIYLGSTLNTLYSMSYAYDLSFTIRTEGVVDFATQKTKYDEFKLPAQPINVLMNDFSDQTFTSIYDVQENDNVQCILSYPTTLNYVILELELKIPWSKPGNQQHVNKYYRFRQRLYDHPVQTEENLQSINTSGTGNPYNLPELPGGD